MGIGPGQNFVADAATMAGHFEYKDFLRTWNGWYFPLGKLTSNNMLWGINQLKRGLIWKLKLYKHTFFDSSDPPPTDILSDIYYHILSHSVWHLIWHSIWHMCRRSIWHRFWHSTTFGIFSDTLPDRYSDWFWCFIWHMFWHIFEHLHFMWHPIWNSIWHFIHILSDVLPDTFSTFYLTFFLAWYTVRVWRALESL